VIVEVGHHADGPEIDRERVEDVSGAEEAGVDS